MNIQFNVVSAEMLREAQKQPDKYKDLQVRVWGYSDYFIRLDAKTQQHIMERTERAS